MSKPKERYSSSDDSKISEKINKILNYILIAFLLISFRLWHLTVIQSDDRYEEAVRPKKKTVLEPAKRATIRDRFNIPLAVNKIQYRASIIYSQIKEIPTVGYTKLENGERVRVNKRKEYIQKLAEVLGKELNLDPKRIVDLIYAKASLYNHLPFVIKEDLTEKEFYRLKMLEKDWLGLQAGMYPKRVYPLGRVASDIIGYIGAINRQEYDKIISEIKELEAFLSNEEEEKEESFITLTREEGLSRLKELKDKAYTLVDSIGKMGIEGYFEKDLRGYHGKKYYDSDARGNFLRELPGGRNPLPGHRLLLTLSSELQAYAEELLIQNESLRKPRISDYEKSKSPKDPWIKGGAIVAMEPRTGEILALASHPRFDPNDFIHSSDSKIKQEKENNILRWFETEAYLGAIWDGKVPMKRERFDPLKGIQEEEKGLSWETYLDFLLPETSVLKKKLSKGFTLDEAVKVARSGEELLFLSGQKNLTVLINYLFSNEPHIQSGSKIGALAQKKIEESFHLYEAKALKLKQTLVKSISECIYNHEKSLMIDLCRMLVLQDRFGENLLKAVGKMTLNEYRELLIAASTIRHEVKTMAKGLFHEISFAPWREANEKSFLKEKRALEKAEKKFSRSYIDYIDEKENELFHKFWSRHKWQLITAFLMGHWQEFHPDENLGPYVHYFSTWHKELEKGAHSYSNWYSSYQTLKSKFKRLEVNLAVEFLQTFRSFEDLDRPLLGRYLGIRSDSQKQLEKHLASAFYPIYGFGNARSYAYRHSTTQGSIFKLVTAYTALTQRYKSLGGRIANSNSLNPLEIIDEFRKEGKDEFVGSHLNGKAIPRFYKGGRLPRSLSNHLGKMDIISAIERSSNPYFALLAGDILKDPDDLTKAAKMFSYGSKTGIELMHEISGSVPEDVSSDRTNLYFLSIGQGSLIVTPLQTAVMLSALANGGKVLKPKILHLSIGRIPKRGEEILDTRPPFLFSDKMGYLGIDFPLFTESTKSESKNIIKQKPAEVIREIFLPEEVRKILIEGMKRVVLRASEFPALWGLKEQYKDSKEAIPSLIGLRGQLVGKTSTSEAIERIDIDALYGTNKYNHLWFGGISFENSEGESNSIVIRDKNGVPELVVVVYLRYGAYGKDTIPIASQLVNKWREIKKKYQKES